MSREEIDARLPASAAWKKSEHLLQVEVFRQIAVLSHEFPELDELFAVPNGGIRDMRTATGLRAEGVKAGVADLCLPEPRHGFHGAWLELKKAKGTIKRQQWDWLLARHRGGYFVRIANCPAVAARLLYDYCAGKFSPQNP
jgi:hypothetical protein